MRPREHQPLRRGPKGRAARFAIAVFVLTMPPSPTGYQSTPYAPPLAGEARREEIAGQPVVEESFRAHLIASPFGTIHAATFRFPQPVGTGIPSSGLQMAAYASGDETAALARSPRAPPPYRRPHAGESREEGSDREFPEINRALKGPRLVPRVRADFDSPQPSTIEGSNPSRGPPAPATGASEDAAADRAEARNANPGPDDVDLLDVPGTAESWLVDGEDAPVRAARIYFGIASLGGTPATMEPWGPGQAPVFEPQEFSPYPSLSPTLPSAACGEGLGRGCGEDREGAKPNAAAPSQPPGNETIAPKGEVTSAEQRPKSPAERLGLIGSARARHEKCLADAIYFEARGESVRGQMAVAQVVINRVFSGYYPNNVCGVVYQNAHRRFRCQFTFACDGIPERINEPAAWERAKHIARDALDGNFWLDDVGKATHYHARWVHPWWVREMRKLDRIGVHTFYRPRNWGDGSKAPTWGDVDGTATAAKTL